MREVELDDTEPAPAGSDRAGLAACPRDDRITAGPSERARKPALARQPDGTVEIGDHDLAQKLLRSRATEQAGFNAALARRLPQRNVSVLFLEGEAHRRQRAAVAELFTPAAIADRHRRVMTEASERLVTEFRREGRAVLDEMTLALSVEVAAAIVGLTDSVRPGLAARLSRILAIQSLSGRNWLGSAWYIVRVQASLLAIYLFDVRPAMRARRRARRPDLVSTLMDGGWSRLDILTECVAYATAGLSTTREFMVVAALHLAARDELRRRFLADGEETQVAILGEILRLEPAVSTLLRRTTAPLRLERAGGGVEDIPAGRLVAIDIRSANADPAVAGGCPFALRDPGAIRGPAGALSFGHGPHRCPGASIALAEAAVFLDRLLRVPRLRIAAGPTLTRHPVSTGYVARGVVISTPD